MELILLKDVDPLGLRGDVVRVRDGFARNFLLPRGLALPSTRANRQFVEEQKVRAHKRREKERTAALAKAENISQIKLRIEAQAGEHEKLFGSVTPEDIAEALTRAGHAVTKKQIHLKEPIRSLGNFPVAVELFPQVKATVTVEVIRKL